MGSKPTARQVRLAERGFKSKVGSPYTIKEAINDILDDYIIELDSGEEYWYDSDENEWWYSPEENDEEQQIDAVEFMEMLLSDFDK